MAVTAVNAAPFVSTLNPNAEHFVPSYFEYVEDFSPDWWSLVKSSPAFRDFWIRERWDIADGLLLDEDLDEDFEEDAAKEDEEEEKFGDSAAVVADALKEQDLNLCGGAITRPRIVKAVDVVTTSSGGSLERVPRDARQKIVQVPSKLAAAQMKKSSIKCRIQQPR